MYAVQIVIYFFACPFFVDTSWVVLMSALSCTFNYANYPAKAVLEHSNSLFDVENLARMSQSTVNVIARLYRVVPILME